MTNTTTVSERVTTATAGIEGVSIRAMHHRTDRVTVVVSGSEWATAKAACLAARRAIVAAGLGRSPKWGARAVQSEWTRMTCVTYLFTFIAGELPAAASEAA